LCCICHDITSDEPYYAPEFFPWEFIEGANGLGLQKHIFVNYFKDSVHGKLVELYPRLRECLQKYYICIKKGERSQELQMVNVGPASGTTINIIFYP
jgi:hypothetical protein